jgi:hypothetical protein
MFEKISDAAEKLASKVSRRDFFGSLGRWAGTAALGVAGLLALGGEAEAQNRGRTICCVFHNGFYNCAICGPSSPWGCQGLSNYPLIRQFPVSNCNQCYHAYPAC